MKNILGFFVLAALLGACSTEPHYVIIGKIDGADSVTFILKKRVDGTIVDLDSAIAYKGSFKMKRGSVKYPETVMLVARDTRMRTTFYLENSEITITGKLDSLFDAKITGSKTHDEYMGFINSGKGLSDRYSAVYNEFQLAAQSDDTVKIIQLQKDMAAIENEMTGLQKDFIKNNPSSFVTPSMLSGLSYGMEGSEIEAYINAMDTAVANTDIIKGLKERVKVMKNVSVGQKAPDFTMNDPEGNPVALYSKIGSKLLFIDFWAAWCGPCRRENPNVVKVYKEFNKKGFDVLGVSLDQNREEWVRAISEDNLTWTQVSDLQYFNNAAARLYAVDAIPSNYLIDEKGIIIARNLRGEALYNKVKEVLDSK